MRLEPVYLLAPEPEPLPTRRRLLWIAAVGCGAAMFGSGYMTGLFSARGTGRGIEPTALDADESILAHAVTLADASEAVLIEHRAQFLYACVLGADLGTDAAQDRLAAGILRLAEIAAREPSAATVNPLALTQRRTLARQILGIVDAQTIRPARLSPTLRVALASLAR